ncbi:MAG: hypothetical protein ACTSQ4_03720 [Candidatus Heimdallarchaeaceae archaeon]
MLETTMKKTYFIYLFLPLLLTSLCFFAVYGSNLASYYENYEGIISSSFPDYAILKENSSIFLNSSYDKTVVIENISLDDYSHIGFFTCQTTLGYFNSSDFVIICAPVEYYRSYVNLSLSYNEIYLESSLRNEFFNDTNSILSTFKISESISLNRTLTINNFIQKSDFFVNDMFFIESKIFIESKYLFMTDITFEAIFKNHLQLIKYYEMYLFQFERQEIYSQPISKLKSYLQVKETEINNYFDYDYQGIEYFFQQRTLKEQLTYLDDNYTVLNFIQLLGLYMLIVIFTVIILSYTSETYVLNQREKIALFRIRGGKRSEIFKYFVRNEIIVILLTFCTSYMFSLMFLVFTEPSFLKFRENYLILGASQFVFILSAGAFQTIKVIRKLTKKRIEIVLEKTLLQKVKNIIKDLFYLSIPVIFYLILLVLLLGIFWTFEMTIIENAWILISFICSLLVFYFLILKDKYLSAGLMIIKLLSKRIHIFNYTKALSQRILSKRLRISKLTIMLILILSFSFSSLDSFKFYKVKSENYNQIGDLTLIFPTSSAERVQQSLAQYVNISIEFQHIQFDKNYITQENDPSTLTIDGYIINKSKITYLFNNEKFSEAYSGQRNLEGIKNKFMTQQNTSIISEELASRLKMEINNSIIFSLSEFENPYRLEIIDVVSITPIFSWLSKYFTGSRVAFSPSYILLNSDFESNISQIGDLNTISTLILSESKDIEIVKERISTLNENEHLGINILDFQQINFADEDYLDLIIKPHFLIFIISVIGFALLFFLFDYSNYVFKKQIDGFRVFFSRGISIKTGIVLGLLPMFLFLSYISLIGNLFGWFLGFLLISILQPVAYIKFSLYVYPQSFIFLISQFIIIMLMVSIIGYTNYRKLKMNIPSVENSENPINIVETV